MEVVVAGTRTPHPVPEPPVKARTDRHRDTYRRLDTRRSSDTSRTRGTRSPRPAPGGSRDVTRPSPGPRPRPHGITASGIRLRPSYGGRPRVGGALPSPRAGHARGRGPATAYGRRESCDEMRASHFGFSRADRPVRDRLPGGNRCTQRTRPTASGGKSRGKKAERARERCKPILRIRREPRKVTPGPVAIEPEDLAVGAWFIVGKAVSRVPYPSSQRLGE